VQQARLIADGPLADADEAPPTPIQLSTHVSALSSAPVHQKTVPLGTVEPPTLALLKHWFKPAIVAFGLSSCVMFSPHPGAPEYWALALLAVLLSRQLFGPLQLSPANSLRSFQSKLARVLLEWGSVVSVLLFLRFALKLGTVLPPRVILEWFALTPILLLLADYAGARALIRTRSARHRHIIIGANEVGMELARRVSQSVTMSTFMGFFDFRNLDRLPANIREQFAGKCTDVAAFVRHHAVDAIFIALPISKAPRIEEMLHEFRDTTASIYFVPDIFAFDLVQARCVEMNGMPMLSICDTPFHGMNAVKKRAVDIFLSSTALLLTWPVMLAAAVAVKLSSPGPVLFKQRRYGLHGEEILVYKFRSMTVCEDGQVVVQARKNDQRFTMIGRILRLTSMDELPQLFNVLQGKMSFVGPRPHAVAHNEQYRKLISGYMIRHKVRPGMTGWAQVHGYRGETSTVEHMRLRVQYDLDYLRHWSLWLDVKILFKTWRIVIRRESAY
jgi:putative colanic acid biosynthesis UDP-glucose lipid carrier transferase